MHILVPNVKTKRKSAMKRIETDRLIIRPMQEKDIHSIHEILRDEETMSFFVEGPYSLSKVYELLNRNCKHPNHYTVMLKGSYRIIGKLSFHKWFMKDTFEIGWIFKKTAQNMGYCTEASKAMVDFGFTKLNLHRIIATCQPENISSKRVCEKLGMRLEGTFKKCIHVKDDIWWDELFYAILKEDYLMGE